jgi:D-alanyl-D-alanine carboxypeptidase
VEPHPSLPDEFGQWYGHRRLWRQVTTQEISLRVNHRRRKVTVRAGVLAAFAFAMVIYPIFGTFSPAASALQYVPGVTVGQAPPAVAVILGEAPGLSTVALPPPSIDATAQFLAVSSNFAPSAYLPGCSGVRVDSGSNGHIDPSTMCLLWDGVHYLRADAAVALSELNHRFFLRFGRNLCLASAYRTVGDQVAVKAQRGYLAAAPGVSPHGWAIAIDLCYTDYKGQYGDWWIANAGAYGWIHPHWAETSLYEPWHWEYGDEHANGQPGAGEASIGPPPDVTNVPVVTVDPSPAPVAPAAAPGAAAVVVPAPAPSP